MLWPGAEEEKATFYLYYAIASACHHKSPRDVHGHMDNVVFAFVKRCQGSAAYKKKNEEFQ